MVGDCQLFINKKIITMNINPKKYNSIRKNK